jgi:hypothetical protein
MKHLATIQTEFLKEARKWDELSLKEQREYLKKHPASKRKLNAKPKTDESAAEKKVRELIESGVEDTDSYEKLLKQIKNKKTNKTKKIIKSKSGKPLNVGDKVRFVYHDRHQSYPDNKWHDYGDKIGPPATITDIHAEDNIVIRYSSKAIERWPASKLIHADEYNPRDKKNKTETKKDIKDYQFAKDAVKEINNRVDDMKRKDYTDKDSIDHTAEQIFDWLTVSDNEAKDFEDRQDEVRSFIEKQLKRKLK